mmetsp:Transcript_69484/g.122889  ORF Transcript_69484/g.122889 Transcript_69484/m.122889 type:complete len:245 (+) Transcript_69484:29-763(+)
MHLQLRPLRQAPTGIWAALGFGVLAVASLLLQPRREKPRDELPPKAPSTASTTSGDEATIEVEEVDFDEQMREESRLLQEAAATVLLVLETEVYRFLPHVHIAEKQLRAIASKLGEVSDLISPHNAFWRYGRDQPLKQLFEMPLLRLAASQGVMVPVTLGHVQTPGDLIVARFLVSGTDASKSRYHEFSSGILDALQRDRLMMRLEWIFHSMWDLPLTWGDDDDDMPLAGRRTAWGVTLRPTHG